MAPAKAAAKAPAPAKAAVHAKAAVSANLAEPAKRQLYAYNPHWKVLKHFIYVQYRCGKQSKLVNSLNHDIMASFPLDGHPEFLNTNQASVV